MVTFSDGSTITYTYGADGTKLKTVHKIGSTTTTTDYCGNVVYENGVQKLLLTEEGYVTLNDNKYHYYLKDHQGNNRVVINQSGSVEETNHYYPFGGVFASINGVQPYKYNGKEFDAKKGLNWYDYGARMYDAALGRFTTVDPSAENYFYTSLYAYCGNNPVNRIDPDGMDYWSTNDPEAIRQFLEAAKEYPYGSGNFLNEVNFSSWNHSTDVEFLGNLTFNDQTNMFYSNYGTIENGIVTSIGVSFPALSNDGENAWLEGGGSKWYKRASGKLDNTYPEFDLFFASTKSGWNILKNVFTSMFRPFSTTNTFDASRSGIIHSGGNREKMGRAKGNMSGNRAVQDEQIRSLCNKYNLDRTQQRTLHDLISGQGYGYKEIEQLIKDYFNK
ncbi:RHS repeat-associated core domain-containing protein [Bacteroides rodentium]